MINLLPPEIKEEYIYGRRNITLRRYAITLGFGLIGTLCVVAAGLLVTQKSIDSSSTSIAQTQTDLKKQNIDGIKAQAQEITDNVKLAGNVLSREVLFSKLVTQIGAVTPKNIVLTNLSITQLGGAIDIKASATDINTATQLQVNLQDPANRIFTKADIQNISCTDPVIIGGKPYPCNISIRALFAKDNPFLFINKGKQK